MIRLQFLPRSTASAVTRRMPRFPTSSLLAICVAALLAGCITTGNPKATTHAKPPTLAPLPSVTYPCDASSVAIYPGGVCALDLNSKTGATVAQAIAASPLDNRTYALAIFANDAAESTQVVAHQALPAWTSWLLVTTDDGHSWTRRDLPHLQLPNLGDATGIESTLATGIAFGVDGVLHVSVSAQRGDGGLVSDGPIGGMDTPHPDATQPTAFLLESHDLGSTWDSPKLLGAMFDYRFVEVAAYSASSWMTVWDNRAGQLSFLATRDSGQSWQWGNQTDGGGRCTRSPMMARVMDGLLTFCAQQGGTRLFHWSALNGSWSQWGDLPADQAGVIEGSALASDGNREVAFVPFTMDPEAELSHDGGKTWPDSMRVMEGIPNDATRWRPDQTIAEPSPYYDAHDRIHLLMPLVDTGVPSGIQKLHIVRQATPHGLAWSHALYPPPPSNASRPPLGVGTLGPTQNFAFHGENGFFIDLEGGRYYLVRVHLSEPQ
jgi:photosystem II stability/assembly factor-like uncharacterized protein